MGTGVHGMPRMPRVLTHRAAIHAVSPPATSLKNLTSNVPRVVRGTDHGGNEPIFVSPN
jgi:hypothetical protein